MGHSEMQEQREETEIMVRSNEWQGGVGVFVRVVGRVLNARGTWWCGVKRRNTNLCAGNKQNNYACAVSGGKAVKNGIIVGCSVTRRPR